MQTENQDSQPNEQPPKQPKGKSYTPKTKLPAQYQLVTPEAAQKLVQEVLTNSDRAQQKAALAALISTITDPNGHPEKFRFAERLLKSLYVETESFKTSFEQYLLKARNK